MLLKTTLHNSKGINLKKFWLIVITSVFIFTQIQAQNGWTKKTDIPTPMVAPCAVTVDNKIYVLGGGVFTDYNDNQVYDPSTNSWEKKQPMEYPRGLLSASLVNDTIYAIGGSYNNPSSIVEAYDPITNTWTRKADMLGPRFGASACSIDGIIYNVGGNHDERNCEAYNPTTNTWTKMAYIPESYGGISVAAYGGLLYAIGGGFEEVFKTVYAYDPETNKWTKKANMPTARGWSHPLPVVDGKIYFIGGYKSVYGEVLSDVEVYNPELDSWKKLPDAPFKSAMFGAAAVNNKIYIIGGTSNWVTERNEVWEYDPFFHTDIDSGDVSGTWTHAKSPYYINGEITIPNDSTLTIEPGVEVIFMGHYKLNVQGRLLAIGTKKDSIRFTAEDKQTGWHGLRFFNTPSTNDTSKIVYCLFKYGNANTGSGFDRCGGAMLIKDFDKVLVSNCLFDSNKQSGMGKNPPEAAGGIYVYNASAFIKNNTFSNNFSDDKSSAVTCVNCPNVTVTNNVFIRNTDKFAPLAYVSKSKGIISGNIILFNSATQTAGGILIDCALTSGKVSPQIENNIIIHNHAPVGGGISCIVNGDPILINNTIAYNSADKGGGIYCSNSHPILINNILYKNSATLSGEQVYINDIYGNRPKSELIFKYCDVQGGKQEFGGFGAGSNFKGIYENNIDVDPLFKDISSNDYGLSNNSLCIGAGIDSIEISGIKYNAPSFDFEGNLRPNPHGSMPDIGAVESNLGKSDFVQLTTHSFMFEGKKRDYNLFLPKNYYSKTKLPVVFNLHGYTLDKVQQMNYSEMNKVADTAGFIVVYPNAVGTAWNCGINATAGHVNDLGFINALIDTLISQYNIDYERIYSCGFSLGGFMSHRLACELSNRIAAIGDVAGTMAKSLLNNYETSHSMPVIIIHGTNDDIVRYNGNYEGYSDWSSVEEIVNHWTGFNQCISSDTLSIPDIDTLDGSSVQRVRYKSFSDSVEVILYKILKGGHSWPGGDKAYLTSLNMGPVGNTNMDINASELIWNFFKNYKLTIPTKVEINTRQKLPTNFLLSQNYPNPFNPSTTIKYQLPANVKSETLPTGRQEAKVRLIIYDILGREVTILVNQKQRPGNYEVEFNCHSGKGRNLTSGVYFYQLKVGIYIETKKMILLK